MLFSEGAVRRGVAGCCAPFVSSGGLRPPPPLPHCAQQPATPRLTAPSLNSIRAVRGK
jgi:hypothetical protein